MEPKNKIVIIPVWDLETDEIIEMEIDQSDLDAMDAHNKEIRDKMEEAYEEERSIWDFIFRDD